MSDFVLVLTQPALVAWLLKATTLLVAALAVTSLLRRASAGTRHLVWLATLAGILIVPAVSLWTPVRLAVLPPTLISTLARIAAPTSEVPQTRAPEAKQVTVAAASEPAPTAPLPAAPLPPSEPVLPFWNTLFGLWAIVTATLVGWLAFGALSVRRIVRSGRLLDERSWTGPLCEIADRLDLDAVPRLVASSLVEMPFACGVVEPTIVLPASAESWSDSRRRAVLFHELAHVKRRDLLGHTLGRIACALYWFHPLVWTAARHLRAESERACDDLVLSCGARASDYADHLLDIVISVRRYGAPATAMPMARRRELEGRVLAILDPAVARIGPGRIQSATLLAGLGALSLSIAAVAPAAERRETIKQEQRTLSRADTIARSRVRENVANALGASLLRRNDPQASEPPNPTKAAPEPKPQPSPAPAAAVAPVDGAKSFSEGLGAVSRYAIREAASALIGEKQKQGIDSAKVALLLKVLRTDPDASVRKMAAWGLSDAGGMLGAADALAEAVRSDEDAEVREMAAWALADSRRESARRALGAALSRDPSEHVRETAAWALANDGVRDEDRELLERALDSDESEQVRETAAWALGSTPRRPAARALVAALGDRSPQVRETAAWALAEIEDEDVAPAVEVAFKRETNAEVRMAELRALTFMHVDDKSILDAALASKDPELRARAVRMLAGSSGSWPEPRPRPRPRPMP